MHCILHTDGGSRGNPGPAGAGAVIECKDAKIRETLSKYLGTTTNNIAEYTAVLLGIEEAIRLGATTIHCFADSELIVRQLSGIYTVKNPALKEIFHKIAEMLTSWGGEITFSHIYRQYNKEADYLANLAMDRKNSTSINKENSGTKG